MANLLALSPLLILLLGAAIVWVYHYVPRIPLLIVIAASLLSLALLFVNARQSNLTPFLFPAFASAPDLDLGLDLSPAGLFFSTIAIVGAASATLLFNWNGLGRSASGLLITLSGVIAFLLAANWTTLAAGWLLADLGLIFWRILDTPTIERAHLPWRAFALSQLGALIFLAAGIFVSAGGSSLRFANTQITGISADLILLAAWIRSGLYPFQIPIFAGWNGARSQRLLRTCITILLGGYLIVRMLGLMQGEFRNFSLFYAISLIAVAAAALLVIVEKESGPESVLTVLAFGAPIFVTPFVAVPAQGAAFVLWLTLGAFNLALVVLGTSLVRSNSRRRPLVRILWAAAILTAAGFPLTPGFLGRVGLYAAAFGSGQGLLAVALSAVATLALIPLWRGFLSPLAGQDNKPNVLEYVGIAGLLLPIVAEGAAPFYLTGLFGREVEDASTFAFDALYHSSSPLGPIAVLASVLLPLPIAFFIARGTLSTANRRWEVQASFTRAFDLLGLRRALILGLDSLGVAARQVSALIEQHPIGWILLAAIWVAVWLLNGQLGR